MLFVNKSFPDFELEIEINNKTQHYYAFKEPSLLLPTPKPSPEYDQTGAMYFAVTVIIFYGISISVGTRTVLY